MGARVNEGVCECDHTYVLSFLPQHVCLQNCLHESYARQVIVTGGGTAACFWAATCQHGDLGAEIVAAANRRVLVFGVGAHVSLQVPPSPFPLDFTLDLQLNRNNKNIRSQPMVYCGKRKLNCTFFIAKLLVNKH